MSIERKQFDCRVSMATFLKTRIASMPAAKDGSTWRKKYGVAGELNNSVNQDARIKLERMYCIQIGFEFANGRLTVQLNRYLGIVI